MKKVKALLLFLLIIGGCSNPVISPPDIPIDQLLSAPTQIQINGKAVKLNAELWEDLMPTVPSSSAKLKITCKVFSEDGSALPSTIELNSVYLVYYNVIWKAFLTKDVKQSKKNLIVSYAENGPAWKAGSFVDVIVKVIFNGKDYLIHAPNQVIMAVY